MLSDVIRERGPMTVAAFMDLALYHPELGYYATRDPLGVEGDFVRRRRSARSSAS